ncbi:MAG TPA: uroporphyrinogen decarboxylase family protein [Terriglobia bacterium]|nr:uroporphyrinogen decarboxylase family protein [Terriglobia bacterium]
MAALAREEPDRLPIAEFVIDPRVVSALCPGTVSQTDFEEIMDFDAVCCGTEYRIVQDYPDGSYVDEWGVLYRRGPEIQDHPVKGPITSASDLERYVPPDPEAPHRLGRLPELVQRFKFRKAIVFRHRAAFMWSAFLNGMDELLMNFLSAPAFAHRLLDRVLEVNLRIARRALRAGADVVMLGDDYAGTQGPLFSPAVFEQFILPRLKRMVDSIHEEGGKVIKHSDGNLWPILDMIIKTGIDGIHPIEPIAGMDIGEVKQKYGKRVCVLGNIDCSSLLPRGAPAEVEAAVKECIRKASLGGGHIICSSNSIHSSVNPKNYLAMIKAAKKFGRYPLRVAELA